MWTNEFISWNPLDFCNISSVSLPMNLFWVPDIYIDERADEDKFTASPFVNISSNGSIIAFQAHRLTSSCNLDVHAFPFDEQKCNLTIMSSAYSDEDILMKSVKTSKMANQDSHKNYLTNGEWKFENLRIIEDTVHYDTFSSSVVTYEVTMTRRSILHVLALILPTFSLFLLDMAISYAPASPEEKIVFKVTLILEVSFLSMILNDKLPTTSNNPPVIAKFFTGMFMFMVLGILENAFILYLRERKPKFQYFKGKKFLSRFLRTEEEKSEDPMTCFETRMAKEENQTAQLPLSENECSDSLAFLKHLNTELQQIKKHLALEECQDDAPKSSREDKHFLRVEKGLYCARLILSLAFLIYIIIKWKQ
uniref:5-hydroxytryptamine receptor 3A-like n=1 Tax=Pogona vitticeps TaxID=103695 RepID=A0ABM5FMP3_9SAUR